MSKTDPVAIVTGGSRGIGREMAREFAGQGYAVMVVHLGDQGEADAAVQEILAARGAALSVRADVTDAVDVERVFDETTTAFGEVDVVVHAAMGGASVVNQAAAARGIAVVAPLDRRRHGPWE